MWNWYCHHEFVASYRCSIVIVLVWFAVHAHVVDPASEVSVAAVVAIVALPVVG